MTRYAILDCETTGLDERTGDRVIEIAVLLVDDHMEELDRLETLLSIERPVAATDVHGIRDEDLVGAPRFAQVAPQLGLLVDGAVVVGHYPRFDLRFIDAELQLLGLGLPTTSAIDTRDTCREAGIVGRLRLVDCCHELGVESVCSHAAMGDVLTTRALLAQCIARGVNPLDHARRFTARSTRAGWPVAPLGAERVLELPRAS